MWYLRFTNHLSECKYRKPFQWKHQAIISYKLVLIGEGLHGNSRTNWPVGCTIRTGNFQVAFRLCFKHRGVAHMVLVWPFILNFIRNVCGLPKAGSKYPEKSPNKRKFALPGVFFLLWASKRQIRAIWRVLCLPVAGLVGLPVCLVKRFSGPKSPWSRNWSKSNCPPLLSLYTCGNRQTQNSPNRSDLPLRGTQKTKHTR